MTGARARCAPMPQVTEPLFLTPRQRHALCGPCPIKVTCLAQGLADPDAVGLHGGVDLTAVRVAQAQRRAHAARRRQPA